MTVFSFPFGASQPHHSGVRFGKCQARRKVKLAEPPASILFFRQSAPTWFRFSGSTPSSPCFENTSQNSRGEFHHGPCGHPLQRVTFVPAAGIAAKANEPCIGSSAASPGLLINNP